MKAAWVLFVACIGCSGGPATRTGSSAQTGGSSSVSGSAGMSSVSGASGASGMGGSSSGAGGGSSGGTGPAQGGSSPQASGGSAGNTVPDLPDEGAGLGAVTECTDPTRVGPTYVRRLSRLEYFHAVRDLFSIQVSQGDLPSDELLEYTFTANVRTRMSSDNFTRYDTMARSVAEAVAAGLSTLAGCSAADTACVEAFLVASARRAFHGELEDADEQALLALYRSLALDDAPLAASTAVRWILTSPRFLFTIEFGTPEGNIARLTPGELAGRLASFLWRSVPDTALLQAAEAGQLATADGIKQQAERMLADAKAVPVLQAFVTEWLGLIPAASGAPALDVAIDQELTTVFTAAAQGAGTYTELLTSQESRGSAELAQFYGTTAAADGSMTVPAERAGLLLRAAFLRTHSSGTRPSPVKRGEQIRRALLCDPVDPPSDPVNMQIPPAQPGVPDRDLFNQHSSNVECWGCHQYMDPIGDAFGAYDATGRFDPSLTPSTAGTIYPGSTPMTQVDFTTTAELIDVLANQDVPQQCFVLEMARFALGRPETLEDGCGLAPVWAAFDAGNTGLHGLLVELAASSLMQVRNTVQAGQECR